MIRAGQCGHVQLILASDLKSERAQIFFGRNENTNFKAEK